MFVTRIMRACAVALVLILTATGAFAGGGGESDTAAAADRTMVRDPATGEMVLAPRYGGSISFAAKSFPPSSDPWFSHHANPAMSGVNEKLAIGDWALDRSIFDYRSDVLPESVFKGWLAESWEMPDDLTMIFTMRDDVFWHDKPPVNGRKLTARDVEFTYHRILGNGSGFTERSPAMALTGQFASVTALDDRTVEFKFSPARCASRSSTLSGRSETPASSRPRSSSSTVTSRTIASMSAPDRSSWSTGWRTAP